MGNGLIKEIVDLQKRISNNDYKSEQEKRDIEDKIDDLEYELSGSNETHELVTTNWLEDW